jgi:DNA uptake protein ComE-like DNA-binding protein
MVLVLASGAPGSFDQVHDFANYPDRQRFITPHLEGSVGYRVEDAEVVLGAERIRSPRAEGNLSGSLRMELWALKGAYSGGSLDGVALGALELGRLGGQNTFESIEARVPFAPPPVGEWQVVLTLREWVDGAGFVTRDHCNFAVPYAVRAAAQPAAATLPVAPAAVVAAPVAAKPVVAAAVVAAPVAAKPVAPAAVIAEPVAAKPVVAAAVVAAPVAVAPVAAKPVVAAPVAVEPVAAKPVVAAPVAVEPVAAKPVAAAPVVEAPVVKVSIMTASIDELSQVPGVNRKLASEIIKHRPYKSLDDLVKVRGIGPKMILILRKDLTV